MVCTLCDSRTKTTNSRYSAKTHSTWRRHTCLRCAAVFTTRERVDMDLACRFISPDGTLSPFMRDKVFLGVYESLTHRKTALEDAATLADTILGRILDQKRAAIDRSAVIAATTDVLKNFDRIAALHYQAKYRD